ncbi:MAG: diaminopimelate decarboxylase, partial [Verrucomicrobiota bacterium]|nr:diaminopimelate decarboxylase [Verrucomicrobiota bacterium]
LKPLGLRILIEPGRFIAGIAGILITRVEYVKQTGVKNFVIVDAAMNDLARPALYDSYHEIVPLTRQAGDHLKKNQVCSDVVGPICESSDYFCKNRMLPKVGEGNHLAL